MLRRRLPAILAAAVGLTLSPFALSLTTATWTGAAGDGRWNNPANWDIGVVPIDDALATYKVIIPASKGTILFDLPAGPYQITNLTLNDASTLEIPAGRLFSVASDATLRGLLKTNGAAASISLAGPGTVDASYAQFQALAGGTLSLPSVFSYRMDWQDYRANRTAMLSDGTSSLIDLSHVSTFNGAAYGSYNVYQYSVTASNFGTIDLSATTAITGAVDSDWLRFNLSNSGNIKLDNLQSVSGRTWFDVQNASLSLPKLASMTSSQFVIGSGSATAPLLASMIGAGTAITLGPGVSLSLPSLTAFASGTLSLDNGASLSLPALTYFHDSDLTLTPGRTLSLGPINNIDYSRIAVSGGVSLSFPNVTSYRMDWQDYRANRTALSADGVGSLIDLSNVATFNGAAYGSYNPYNYIVNASNSGTINLSGVTVIYGTGDSDWLKFQLVNNGAIPLDNLQSINGRTWFDIQNASLSLPLLQNAISAQFVIGTAGSLSIPNLKAMNGPDCKLSIAAAGQTLSAPSLLQFNGGTLAASNASTLSLPLVTLVNATTLSVESGSTLSMPNLVTLTDSTLSLIPGRNIITGPISNLDYSRVSVSNGATIAFPNVTSYRMDWQDLRSDATALSADGAGSQIDLSHVLTFNGGAYGSYNPYNYRVIASNSGTVDLSGVTAMTGTADSDWLAFSLSNNGVIKLDSLLSVSKNTWFNMQNASLALPSLNSTANTQFILEAGGSLSLPNLSSMSGAGTALYLNAANTLSIPCLVQFSNGLISLSNGSTLSVPALVTLSDSDLSLSPGRTLNLGPVSNIDYSRIAVSGGVSLALPNVTSYRMDWQDYRANRTALSADGVGSLLDLSHVSTLNGAAYGSYNPYSYIINASNSGTVDLSGLTAITGSTDADWLKFAVSNSGLIKLDNLTSVTNRTWFDVLNASLDLPNLNSTTQTQLVLNAGSSISAPKLSSMTGAGTAITLANGISLSLPSLNQFANGAITLGSGSNLSLPILTLFSDSDLSLSPGRTLALGPISNLDYSRIAVSGGVVLSFPLVTSYRMDWQDYRAARTALSADGAGSKIDLSKVSTFNGTAYGSYNEYSYIVSASNSGVVDLSAVTAASGAVDSDWLKFAASSGGTIKLNSLKNISNRAWFDASTAGTIDLGSGASIASTGTLKLTASGAGVIQTGNLYLNSNITVSLADPDTRLVVLKDLTIATGASFAPSNAQTVIGGSLKITTTAETAFAATNSTFLFNGTGAQTLECAGTDAGAVNPANNGNFGLGQLVLGTPAQPAIVQLVDAFNNGNRSGAAGNSEALYLGVGQTEGLVLNAGSTLKIGAYRVYATEKGTLVCLNNLFAPGDIQIPYKDGYIALDAPPVDLHWTAGSGNWDTTSNWSLDRTPLPFDRVYIDPAAGATVAGPTVNATLLALNVGTNLAAANSQLNLNQNVVTTVINGATVGPRGSVQQSAGTLSAASLSNTGAFSQSAGALLQLGALSNSATLDLAGQLLVSGPSVNHSQMTLQSGSTAQLQSLSGGGNLLVDSSATLHAQSLEQSDLTLQGTLNLAPKSAGGLAITLNSLSLGAAGKIDLADGVLVLNYTDVSPIETIVQQVIAGRGQEGGFADGPWNGTTGITSSLVADTNNNEYGYENMLLAYGDTQQMLFGIPTTVNGIAVDPGVPAIVVTYALLGDATLDGVVNGDDFEILKAYYGTTSGAHWYEADFNYDGKVNGTDFELLKITFGQTLPSTPALAPAPSYTLVPEPGTLSLLALASLPLLRRKRH